MIEIDRFGNVARSARLPRSHRPARVVDEEPRGDHMLVRHGIALSERRGTSFRCRRRHSAPRRRFDHRRRVVDAARRRPYSSQANVRIITRARGKLQHTSIGESLADVVWSFSSSVVV